MIIGNVSDCRAKVELFYGKTAENPNFFFPLQVNTEHVTQLLADISHYFPITDPTWIFFVVLCIILFAPMLLNRLHIPHIIGMVLAGILVGEYGLGLLRRDASFQIFGEVGLYYIMFTAGLGMDIGGLKRNLSRGLTFGAATVVIPGVAGYVVGHFVLHYPPAASLLLACILASHTLVAFPIVTRYGLMRHISVTISVGATMLAVLGSLLVLAGISGTFTGSGDAVFWVWLAVKCILFCLFMFFALPPIIRGFFHNVADNVFQYIFVLIIVFFSAAFSKLCGLEGIFGAFLAGLVLNRYIPPASPLMHRIDFVGNALFIPYFLIGVGMLINVGLLFEGWHTLWVVLVILATATVSKGLAAWTCQRLFRWDKASGWMMFGLSNGHAAGALAMVMVGTALYVAPGQPLMSDEVMNAIVMLILFSCIISSFATEHAAKELALHAETGTQQTQDEEKIMIALHNPSTVSSLVALALIGAHKRGMPLVAVNVVLDNAESEKARAQGLRMLDKAVSMAAAVDIKMETQSRWAVNVTSGLIHAMKEFRATEIIIGLHQRQHLSDIYYGRVAQTLIAGIDRQISVLRCTVPFNTLRRIHVLVPSKAQFEVGFQRWIDRIARIAGQLDGRITFYAHPKTLDGITCVMQERHDDRTYNGVVFTDWSNLVSIASHVASDHLVAVVAARRGTLSYKQRLDTLPDLLERYFSSRSLLVIYPDQYGSAEVHPSSFSAALSPSAPHE